jgi:hypothetical protein
MARPHSRRPQEIFVAGTRYKATLMRVLAKGADGLPRDFRLLRDDEVTDLGDGEQVFVVYALPALSLSRG